MVIDAGHGGHDPGAIGGSGLREKDVTLKIAREIRDALLRSGRVRVALTRDDDRYLVLQERYGVARKLHADLFISIHCDSVGEGNATGASVYTLSEVASDKESARLAARENKADIIAGIDLADATPDISSILIDLTQRETMNSSANFARLLGREAQGAGAVQAEFPPYGVADRAEGTRHAVDPVRDRLYLQSGRRAVPRLGGRAAAHRRRRAQARSRCISRGDWR